MVKEKSIRKPYGFRLEPGLVISLKMLALAKNVPANVLLETAIKALLKSEKKKSKV